MGNGKEKHEAGLTVKGESIESAYRQYLNSRFWVNRRYQRKLIWTIDEKRGFVDSIIKGYPVPIILLAEDTSSETSMIEIIDGMQRLNAIMSFINNDFELDGRFFDLNTMAATKHLLDAGDLKQKEPVLDRAICVNIASYLLPVSIFEFSEKGAVDEVFRRINSGGRKLSRQELRAAGSLGRFATVVRKLAADLRGDSSLGDTLRLNDMTAISITNRELEYGIPVDSIFWVKHNILTKEQVRESRDEEIISDIIAYMVLEQPPSARSEFLDDYFGLGDDDASVRRYGEVETAIQRLSVETVKQEFEHVFDALRLILADCGQTFGQLFFDKQPARAPRYFQVVFLALYTLIVRENMAVSNTRLLLSRMENQAPTIQVSEGGRWGSEDRHKAIQAVAGVYREAFAKDAATDPSAVHWITKIESLLSSSLTEQSAFDVKQGFLRLDGDNAFDEASFEKILKTCVGIANIRRGYKGYILCGVCDDQRTAERVEQIFGVSPRHYLSYWITGVEHEAHHIGKSSDQMFQFLVDRISASAISEPLRAFVARNLKPIRYFDQAIYIFEIEGQDDPSTYDGTLYDRSGAQLKEVPPKEMAAFVTRYLKGK